MGKLYDYTFEPKPGAPTTSLESWDGTGYGFHCPACGNTHVVRITGERTDVPRWTFNGDRDRPTFRASVLVNRDQPERLCHSYVTDGRIQYLADCGHQLAGQTVDLPDLD